MTKSFRGLDWATPDFQEVNLPGVPKLVTSIAKNRGIEDFKEFFRPTLRGSMPDPHTLICMKEAIERTAIAVQKKQKVYVYGDYDVDGATSSAQLVRYIRDMGCEVDFYIPDRMTEGYGPNVPAMERIGAEGTDLLIIADSGTTAFEPVAAARKAGMDVIILDHHTAEEELPDAIVVNPNRKDETGEFSYLCTAGLAFLFLVGLQRHLREEGFFENRAEFNLNTLLGIAALGTVADVVPLRGLNRAYVHLGIPSMAVNPGLAALAEACDVKPEDFSTHTCGFVFGPAINAGGRIDDTKLGTKLLSSDDPVEVAEIAEYLTDLNMQRKEMQSAMENDAHEQAKSMADDQVIIVYGENWHPGVIGIVASRVKDAFDRSAIVIGQDGKGSARAIEGFDIGSAIIAARKAGILIAGGGHPAAGGLTIDVEKIDEFRAFMNGMAKDVDRPPLRADIEVDCGSLHVGDVESFQMLAPFGMGNSEPRLVIRNGYVSQIKILKGKHIKGRISGEEGNFDFIMFGSVGSPMGEALRDAEGKVIDMYGRAKINSYMGNLSIQIFPEDFILK